MSEVLLLPFFDIFAFSVEKTRKQHFPPSPTIPDSAFRAFFAGMRTKSAKCAGVVLAFIPGERKNVRAVPLCKNSVSGRVGICVGCVSAPPESKAFSPAASLLLGNRTTPEATALLPKNKKASGSRDPGRKNTREIFMRFPSQKRFQDRKPANFDRQKRRKSPANTGFLATEIKFGQRK